MKFKVLAERVSKVSPKHPIKICWDIGMIFY